VSSLRPILEFPIYDWLHVERLAERPRFADHSLETIGAASVSINTSLLTSFGPAWASRR